MATAARRLRLIGRGEEVAELEAELRRAVKGELRCVLLLADPGVGKTRLATELLLRNRGTVIGLSARAYPLGGTASFGLWVEALERYLASLPPAEVRSLCGGVVDDLASALRSVTAVRGKAPEHETPHLRLLQAFAVLLRNLAVKYPVVMLLDDVHLADVSSWEALSYLARNLSEARILIVAAARPAELSQGPDAMETVLGLEQDGLLHKLVLRPLDRTRVRDLAQGILDGEPPDSLVDWLYGRSRGNPLFAIGLLRTLLDEGSDLSEPALQRVPQGLSDRVMARLTLLSEPQRATLEVLAVVGRRVELRELIRLSGRPLDRLAPILEALVRLRLITEEERGRELIYEVAHPLIQEAIYQAIGGARRRAIHRLVARALAAAGQRAAAASHYVRCAEAGEDEAIDALIEALRQAEERQSHREAMPILGALIDLLPPGDSRWLRVLDAMDWDAEWVIDHQADLYSAIGVQGMRQIERVLPPSELLRQGVVQLRRTSFAMWDLEQCRDAIASAQRSRSLLLEAGEPRRALAPLHELSWAQSIEGDLQAQETTARRVIAEAEGAGDRMILNHALGSLAWSLFRRGQFAESEAALRRSVEIAHADGRHYRHAWSLSSLAYCVAGQGRIDEALPLLKESRAASPAYADTVLFGITAYVQLLAGNFAAGLASWSESAAWNEGRLSARRAWGMIWAALSAPELGRVEEAERYLAQARRIFGDWAGMGFGGNCDWLAGCIARARGELPSSLAALQMAARRLLGYQVLPDAALVLADLCEVAGELHDGTAASRAATELQEIARRLGAALYQGLADLAAAWAALVARRDAADLARRAVATFEPTSMRAFHGRALDILGRALAERDREAAGKALGQAAEIFIRCGAARRRDRAIEALARLGPAGRRVAVGTEAGARLTAREREVVRLAMDGLTAREIGFRLFIGERTVETHLANAYAKLGVDSRLDLIRRAAELSI